MTWHTKPSRRDHAHIFDANGRLLARNIPERGAATLVAEHNETVAKLSRTVADAMKLIPPDVLYALAPEKDKETPP